MSDIQAKLQTLKSRWLAALPTILVSMFLLLSIWALFGVQQVIMSSFLTLLFRTRHQQDFRPREMLRVCITMLVICLVAFVASRTLLTSIVFNFFVPFGIVYLLSDKFNPKSYFVYGMEFVFLQLVPISAEMLPMQLAALGYGLAVVTAALYGYAHLIHRRRHYGTVRKGLKNLSAQLDKLAQGQDITAEHLALPPMMVHMNEVIYSSRNYTYLANGYGKINYWFMVLFQRFYYFTDHFVTPGVKPCEQDATYYKTLSQLLSEISDQLNQKDNHILLEHLQTFLDTQHLADPRQDEAMEELLQLLMLALGELEHCSMAKPQKSWKLASEQRMYRNWRGLFQLEQFQIRFALRLSVVLCFGFSFVRITGLEHAYWYPMTAFLMLMPYAEESLMKINNRILGTLGGVAVSICLMSFFHTMPQYIAIMIVMTCFMYYVPVTSWTMTVYSTCYGMTLAQLRLGVMQASQLRIVYVLLAAVTAFLANRFLLPNTAKREFRKSVEELFELDLAMVRQMKNQYETGHQDLNQMRDPLVRSHLLENEITTYMNTKMTQAERDFYSQMLPMNRQLMSEIEQLTGYLRSRRDRLAPHDNLLLRELLNNLEESIQRVKLSYTQNQLVSFLETDREQKAFGKLEDKMYFNSLALNCIQTLQDLTELAKDAPKHKQ